VLLSVLIASGSLLMSNSPYRVKCSTGEKPTPTAIWLKESLLTSVFGSIQPKRTTGSM